MTKKRTRLNTNCKWKEKKGTLISSVLLIATCYFALNVSGEISESVKEGMSFAVRTIIPSAFPFMIIADLYTAYGYPERLYILSKLFTGLTGIPKCGVRAFICGNISGFPIGAKIASELHTAGGLSRENAEKLCAYSNNPSIPFVLGAVGVGLFKNVRIGLFLLFTVYISCILTARVFKRKGRDGADIDTEAVGKFDFVTSIKSAGTSSLNIIFFVTAFFALLGTIKTLTKSENLLILCSIFLEVSSAVSSVSLSSLPEVLKVSLCSFALSFGSLSVMMQSSHFMRSSGLGLAGYFRIKLIQGLFSFILSHIMYPIMYILL